MKPTLAAMLAILVVPLPGNALGAESLQRVLEKVAAAYGPPPAAVRETGSTRSFLQGEGTLVRLYKFPDRFHIEIKYPNSEEDRTMIGDRVWNRHTPANPMSRGAIILQAARIALPWTVLSRRSTAVDLGTKIDEDGRSVQVIEFPLGEQRTIVAEIDPARGYILRSSGSEMANGTVLEFATRYSDFRVIDGRVHAAHEEQTAKGIKTGYSVIEKIEYLDSLPDSDFAPWAFAWETRGFHSETGNATRWGRWAMR